VYYLITKVKYSDKPTYNTLKRSLQDMKQHCTNNNVSAVSMPLIGCGLDGLKWNDVRDIVKEVFSDVDIKITVYSL
jgi:O-acetyl-ADP-ribose deacetylase (regulator of RNase III)